MGKMILTTGNYSSKGYLLKNSKQSIYSIEELCYHIVRTVDLCEDYLYDVGLARFIRDELGLKERGNLLENLIERDAPVKDLMAICLYSCNYLTGEETEEILQRQQRLERSEPWMRLKGKADSYLRQNNFRDAGLNYEQLLEERNVYGITSETLGDIYHNLAFCQLQTDGFAKAVENFRIAFEKNRREESLKQFLLALWFSGKGEDYELALEQYGVPEDIVRWLGAVCSQTELETREDVGYVNIESLRELLERGKINEFYSGARRVTEHLKEQYRKYNE